MQEVADILLTFNGYSGTSLSWSSSFLLGVLFTWVFGVNGTVIVRKSCVDSNKFWKSGWVSWIRWTILEQFCCYSCHILQFESHEKCFFRLAPGWSVIYCISSQYKLYSTEDTLYVKWGWWFIKDQLSDSFLQFKCITHSRYIFPDGVHRHEVWKKKLLLHFSCRTLCLCRDGWMDGKTDEKTNEWMNDRTNKRTTEQWMNIPLLVAVSLSPERRRVLDTACSDWTLSENRVSSRQMT